MNAIAIADAYRKIIARFIVNERKITSAVATGDVVIAVESARRFQVGEKIVLIDKNLSANNTYLSEVATIYDIPDNYHLVLESGAIGNYQPDSLIRKILGAEQGVEDFIKGIYVGKPNNITHYPAITVDVKSRSSDWFTLNSTKETYSIEIALYCSGADYEQQYRMMHAFVDKVESALFRSFYPLVEPYWQFTLAEDVSMNDSIIKIDQDALFCGAMIFFESIDYLAFNRIEENKGNGVYRLRMPVGLDFSAGDHVIIPRRHIFNTLPEGTQYGITPTGMLKTAVITLRCEEEVLRYYPYLDPLTF